MNFNRRRAGRLARARKRVEQKPRGWGSCLGDPQCPPGLLCLPISPDSSIRVCQKAPITAPPKGGKGGPGRLSRSRKRLDPQPRQNPDMPILAEKWLEGAAATPQRARRRRGRRMRNGCYHPGKMNHAGRAVVACRMGNPGHVDECFDLDSGEPMPCGGAPAGSCMNTRGCITYPADCETGEPVLLPFECPEGWTEHRRDGRVVGCTPPKGARLHNPGPNGEFRMVPPFCASGSCGRTHCGTCNPANYAFPGRVDTVAEAVDRMHADIDAGMAAASAATRQMYAPGASAWSDPNVALLTKPGGPAPRNALPTAQWSHCSGPAVAAHPSSNRQIIPGGTP